MSNFILLFKNTLTAEETEELMRLAYNNVERKDSVLMIKTIMNTPNIDTESMFNTLVGKITWDNKYKFVVLTELLAANPNLVSSAKHDEFIKVIIQSQNNGALASVAGKLYSTLVDVVPERIWLQKYFPAILSFIQKEYDVRWVYSFLFFELY